MISGLWLMTYDFHFMIFMLWLLLYDFHSLIFTLLVFALWFLLYGFGFIISCPTDKLKNRRIRIIKVEIVNLKSESLILKPKS